VTLLWHDGHAEFFAEAESFAEGAAVGGREAVDFEVEAVAENFFQSGEW
jgi:hypothetical protein